MTPSEMRPSKKQRELLDFIENFINEHGYGPSYREIMRGMGYKSVSTVAIHIDNLISKECLRKRTRSARSLEVMRQSAEVPVQSSAKASPEKWLVGQVDKRFQAVEKSAKKVEEEALNDLYVLVGTLHILGMKEHAESAKSRLMALKEKVSAPVEAN
ncbi:MAG TPA: hypothetical protein VGS28_01945 [Candidatus Saccharimonadales bacterium]|nr:hypothetical protein [Candidatus Saccharimonadales bacterium]